MLYHFKFSSGIREEMFVFQLHRNSLVVLCRQLLSMEGSFFREQQSTQTTGDSWIQWVRNEAVRRVLHFTWCEYPITSIRLDGSSLIGSAVLECFQALFLMLPPLLPFVELQIPLPCCESLWRANRQTWFGLMGSETNTDRSSTTQVSVCSLFARFASEHVLPEGTTESARLALLFASFFQHASMRELARTIVIPQQASPYADIATSLEKTLESTVQTLLDDYPSPTDDYSGVADDCSALTRLIVILVFTPLRLLLPFSRWQSAPQDSENARKQLRHILNQDDARARDCALHAAQLFGRYRKQAHLIHIDPWCLLFTHLYLWAFIELAIPHTDITSTTSGTQQRRTIRIDHALDKAETTDWIKQGGEMRPHITGVGMLNGQRSSVRLMKETARIMCVGGTRSALAASLSHIISSSAKGNIPTFHTPE